MVNFPQKFHCGLKGLKSLKGPFCCTAETIHKPFWALQNFRRNQDFPQEHFLTFERQCYFRLFCSIGSGIFITIHFTDGGIQNEDLWCWKQPLYQLSHHLCPNRCTNFLSNWLQRWKFWFSRNCYSKRLRPLNSVVSYFQSWNARIMIPWSLNNWISKISRSGLLALEQISFFTENLTSTSWEKVYPFAN